MERQIMWSPWTGPGLEHLLLRQQQEDIVADSLILGVEEQRPFRVRYEIHCDQQWRLRAVHLAFGVVKDYPGLFRRVGTW
jgi:uncharacterized protein